MDRSEKGVVAAGHPLTAQAGARILREGGNAVDAAVGAMAMSFVAEPLLTGLGAGGYMIVGGGEWTPALLDFFVEAPTRPVDGTAAELIGIDVSFGDAEQVFHIGPASCGIYGAPYGVCEAARRWGTIPLGDLLSPAATLARAGVRLNRQQAYVGRILEDLLKSTPECSAIWARNGEVLKEGETLTDPDLADALVRLGQEGAEPFYRGDIAAKICEWLASRGGSISVGDLSEYRPILRTPAKIDYRQRQILTNPPPSAGGTLLAYSLGLLDREPSPPPLHAIIDVMRRAQAERTTSFAEGLLTEGYLNQFMSSRLGSTTHISVIDAAGRACGVTATNGEGSGVIVPGTGVHLNNIMGEQDLNPLGFHRHPARRRMASMVAPSLVMSQGEVEMVLGSAGSNRIRSAILQTIVGVVDRGLGVEEAVTAPRAHFEDGVVYLEPGIDPGELLDEPETSKIGATIEHNNARVSGDDIGEVVRFHALNLFFGGVQAVMRRDNTLTGAGDPRRGGVAVRA